jgi:hypothetical protein
MRDTVYRHIVLPLMLAFGMQAQGVRSHTKPKLAGTRVTEAQAQDLTLTLAGVAVRPIQTWVRTAGDIDKSKRTITVSLRFADARLVAVGQRARSFSPESKSSMYQARVTRVIAQPAGAAVEIRLAATSLLDSARYVVEIVVDRGQFLSIPNEAIIEEGVRRIVYMPGQAGQYVPREIQTGQQGELYTQVLDGLKEGDQVVTLGSFFIDAEYKLKGSGGATPVDASSESPIKEDDRHNH